MAHQSDDVRPLPPGNPLPCIACGRLAIPSYRLEAHDGSWIELQQGRLPLGGCCSQTCSDSIDVEDSLRQDNKLTIRVARSRSGVHHVTSPGPALTVQNMDPLPDIDPHRPTGPTPT